MNDSRHLYILKASKYKSTASVNPNKTLKLYKYNALSLKATSLDFVSGTILGLTNVSNCIYYLLSDLCYDLMHLVEW